MNEQQTKQVSVFGIFQSREEVETAVNELKAAGFSNSDISVLFAFPASDIVHENSTKGPEGAAAGAVSGAAIGGVLGWLAGIGTLTIPGVGPLIAAGPIMAALAGLGVGGAIGGISGALIGLGVPEYEAKRYQTSVEQGGILISIHAETTGQIDVAKRILDRTGAQDISSKSDKQGNQNLRQAV